jgi:hypothetical protein
MSTVRCKVLGPYMVADVAVGGEVELDNERVNVKALVKAGLVEVLPDKPAEKPAAKPADKK